MKFIKKVNAFIAPEDEDLSSMNLKWWYEHSNKCDKIKNIIHIISYIAIILLIYIFMFYAKPREELINQIIWLKENIPFFKGYFAYIFVIVVALFILLVTLILHEFIHIMFIPNCIKSDKTYVGMFFIKDKFNGYAVRTYEPMSKMRYLFMVLAPVILLSVIPIAFMLISPYWNFMIITVCFLNIFGSSNDIYTSYLIFKRVPKNAVIISGYYK
ncbi:MAG: DUF3267 domain-containing protein [Eubacteriales bacterium]